MWVRTAALAALCLPAVTAWSAHGSYADPTLLDMPWGYYSFVRPAWRGYAQTVPAAEFLRGLGVVWGRSPPGSDEDTAAALAWAGFRRVRIEVPWGSVRWDERGFDEGAEKRLGSVLPALRRHGLRPLILLNANHGRPCPVHEVDVRLGADAAAGGTELTFANAIPGGLEGSPVTISSLADGSAPGPLVVDYREEGTGATVRLSKPLPRPLAAGDILRLTVLKYAPLDLPGTASFERTARGWLDYVELVTRYMTRFYGSDDYDVEIWNELTFGSAFLDVMNYQQPVTERSGRPDLLRPGGQAWELANRTARLLKQEHPSVRVIWGFSNTTWFHTPISELPVGTDGQSYHPYGTGRRCYAAIIRGQPERMLDGFVPDGCAIQPEGYAHTWQQTESLMRLIAPAVTSAHPPQGAAFAHFITEHGMAPAEIGIQDAPGARESKRKFLLRAPLFWLNKGISGLFVFDAYESSDTNLGVFDADGTVSPGMTALHNLTQRFAADTLPGPVRQLEFDVKAVGPDPGILAGDPAGRHLRRSQAVALLPYQLDAHRFLIGAYVMTQDFPRDLPAVPFRITIGGLAPRGVMIDVYDPGSDKVHRLDAAPQGHDAVSFDVSLTDVPRLIEVHEGGVP